MRPFFSVMKQSVFNFENEGFYYLFKEHSLVAYFFSCCINNANKNKQIKVWLVLEEQTKTSHMDTLY